MWKHVMVWSLVLLGGLEAATLPRMSESPWLGWYVGWRARGFRFGVMSDGKGVLVPAKSRREDMSPRYWIKIEPVIEELRDDRVVTKMPVRTGWEAVTPEGEDPETATYRGTTTGGARFEAHFEVDGWTVRGGGRILDRGKLTKHPVRLAFRVQIPNVYYSQRDENQLAKLAKRDRIEMLRADGTKLKFGVIEEVFGEEQNGAGIREARLRLAGYQGERIELRSGEAGLFEFWNKFKGPLYKGFTMAWKPDPAKDPDGTARFELMFR